MNRIPKRPVLVGAVIGATGLAALLLALSFSGGSDPAADTTTTPSAGGRHSTVSAAQAWHNLAQCFRSHGYQIADPTVNADGTSSWSASAGPPPHDVRKAERAVGDACDAAWHALPAQAVSPPPTQAELHAFVLFAQCMRANGLADWPDPNARGAFPLDDRLFALGKRGIMRQLHVCDKKLPGNGISISRPGDRK
ncbi:MAG TPA: hypothetical protein VGQ38_21905 [Gaiellaceae bacterium]|jgi:hypothetical protein|nr:hypothetical protein [Gaiellaceae bacterium]